MGKIRYVIACDDNELSQILRLQQANLSPSLTEKEKKSEGFVTVAHTLELLRTMNDKCAHILAKDGNLVVGYALCMHPDFRNDIDILKPMFRKIESVFNPEERYLIMGQICIAKSYRKRGIFRGLYQKMQESMQEEFPNIITEVDEKNQRSLLAHYAVGFQDLCKYHTDGIEWTVLLLK